MTVLAVALGLLLAQEKTGAVEKQGVQEKIVVDRVIVTGRVLDRFAKPILDLTAADFRLRVDGLRTPIESVEWIPGRRQQVEKPVEKPARRRRRLLRWRSLFSLPRRG